jgi:hypothetical protein
MQRPVGIAVRVQIAVKKKGKLYLAKCPFLNMMSQGTTRAKAIEQLRKEMEFLFSVCAANGSLEALLDKRTAVRRPLSSPDDFVLVSKAAYVDLPAEISPEILKRFADAAASAD